MSAPSARGRLRDFVDDPVEDRLSLSGERRLARQALVEHGAERSRCRSGRRTAWAVTCSGER